MKTALVRTGSVPVLSPVRTGSPSSSFSHYKPFPGNFSRHISSVSSPRTTISLQHSETKSGHIIRRAFSESDISGSLRREISNGSGAGSRSFPSRIPEEEDLKDHIISNQKLGFSGSGIGGDDDDDNVRNTSSGSGGGDDRSKIGEYYEKMLKLNPSDSLLLRNYGKFLQEVENDTERAEEYYGRAILASPGDGELLQLYGKLVWETQRDEERAQSYFDRAIVASPQDCTVVGSCAHFFWKVGKKEEEEEDNSALVTAF